MSLRLSAACVASICLSCGSAAEIDSQRQAVEPFCHAAPQPVPDSAWACGETREISCENLRAGVFEPLHFSHFSCGGTFIAELSDGVDDTTRVTVLRGTQFGALDEICEASLKVRDDEAPEVETHTKTLWPPNHKLHAIGIEDCVTVDDCDPSAHAYFTYVSSDEPMNARGDGNHEPDVVGLGCTSVSLRAERQGPKDGRSYTLGFEAVDGSGHVTAGACQVIVAHDQSGRAVVHSGESYRIDLDDGFDCAGSNDAP